MPRPHGSQCRCPQPLTDEGLLHFTVDCEHYRQLAAILAKFADSTPPTPVLEIDAPRCDGSMMCSCKDCEAERAERLRNGVRHVRQPWEAKAA